MAQDELERLMPRTTAANEASKIDSAKVREYFQASDPVSKVVAKQSKKTIRKDEQGFEDIDEFWVDGDETDGRSRDNTEADTTLNSSLASAEGLPVNAKAILSENSFDLGERDSGSNTHEVDFGGLSDDNIGNSIELAVSKQTDPNVSFSRHKDEDPANNKDSVPTKPQGSRSPDTGVMSEAKSNKKSTPSTRKKSKGARSERKNVKNSAVSSKKGNPSNSPAAFSMVGSPFSVNEAPVTPGSNASQRDIKLLKPFSELESPPIQTKLFSTGTKASISKLSTDNKQKKTQKLAEMSTPSKTSMTKKKAVYRDTPPGTDTSADLVHTDNDSTFRITDMDSERDQSYLDENSKGVLDLSHAQDVLRDRARRASSDGLRRSGRKRYKPLAWYKGEHYVFERRQSGIGCVIPTVVGVERAGTHTPSKLEENGSKSSRPTRKPRQPRTKLKPFPREKLPKEFTYQDNEWAEIYDHTADCLNRMNIICRANEIEHRQLPPSEGQTIAGFAGQSFNLNTSIPYSRWISGRLLLPPGASKEAESVGEAVQIFYVQNTQPDALEVAYTPAISKSKGETEPVDYFDLEKATRFLLRLGDEFYIPTRNAYYLKNHSETAEAELRFLILRANTYKSDQQNAVPDTKETSA
ncbi:unnamed protein product [Albugo candida]|uniref:Mif2/CENP-C cupin domain-containing protein n=1 Tax=Albugo candida TaxID=65357 RepID=A0A024G599_9STRA|nr:unnamed protein product [Albugo candida]|eukprot:CCI42039.1 unnamed protein product [Albugo candida]